LTIHRADEPVVVQQRDFERVVVHGNACDAVDRHEKRARIGPAHFREIDERDLVGAPLAALDRRAGAVLRVFPLAEQRFVERDRLIVVGWLQRQHEAAARRPGREQTHATTKTRRHEKEMVFFVMSCFRGYACSVKRHVSSRFLVSGIQIQANAAIRNAAPAMAKATPNPLDCATEPTVYGAAALAMRPKLW